MMEKRAKNRRYPAIKYMDSEKRREAAIKLLEYARENIPKEHHDKIEEIFRLLWEAEQELSKYVVKR